MEIIFNKDEIITKKDKDSKVYSLINFEEKEFFAFLESIINNKDNLTLTKGDNIAALGLKFYDIFNRKIQEIVDFTSTDL